MKRISAAIEVHTVILIISHTLCKSKAIFIRNNFVGTQFTFVNNHMNVELLCSIMFFLTQYASLYLNVLF